MRSQMKGALALLVLGIVVLLSIYFILPVLREKRQRETSDAAATKGKIIVGVDSFVGYVPLRSSEMKKRMLSSGYLLEFVDDNANYRDRMERLAKGELQLAVATVDSYILNAADLGMPGVIVMVIDESKGGDGLVAWKQKIDSLDALKRGQVFKIAFTPDSPSHHLVKVLGIHFDIPEFKTKTGPWRVDANGSPEALKKFLAHEVDAAVLWEPDISRALAQPDAIKLIGTEHMSGVIVDILLANRGFSRENPEVVDTVLSNYFRTLKVFRDSPEILQKEVINIANPPVDTVDTMLKGVKWANLAENCEEWFGIGSSGLTKNLIDVIDSTVQILVAVGDFRQNPLPEGDPNRIIQSSHLVSLFTKGLLGDSRVAGGTLVDSLSKKFIPLDDKRWNEFREVGTLRVPPIVFQSGKSELTLQGKEEIDKAVESLKHYPDFRIAIKGHTDTQGDAEANQILSRDRGEAVKTYLEITYGVDSNRIKVIGLGGDKPLLRLPGESERSYRYRLPRVEIALVSEVY